MMTRKRKKQRMTSKYASAFVSATRLNNAAECMSIIRFSFIVLDVLDSMHNVLDSGTYCCCAFCQ